MSNDALQDRYLDVALAEVTGGRTAPDLAAAVASASAAERRAALQHVELTAPTRAPHWRPALLCAAVVLLGVGVLWGIWSSERGAAPRQASQAPWQDRVQDPDRVVPRSVEELSQLLQQVESMAARGCTVHLVSSGMKLDVDRGLDGFAEVDPAARRQLLAEL